MKKRRFFRGKAKKRKVRERKAPAKKPAAPRPQGKSSIEFCERCGSIMVPVKRGKTSYIKCRGCGREQRKEMRSMKIVEEAERKKGVVVLEKDPTLLPLTDKECPKCEHGRAYWWMQQTRSADEPPTQFFRCEKCKHTWREYK